MNLLKRLLFVTLMLLCLTLCAAHAQETTPGPEFKNLCVAEIQGQLYLTGQVVGGSQIIGIAAINQERMVFSLILNDQAWQSFLYPVDETGRFTLPITPSSRPFNKYGLTLGLCAFEKGSPIPLPYSKDVNAKAVCTASYSERYSDMASLTAQAQKAATDLGLTQAVPYPLPGGWPFEDESFAMGPTVPTSSTSFATWMDSLLNSVLLTGQEMDGRSNFLRITVTKNVDMHWNARYVYQGASTTIDTATITVSLQDKFQSMTAIVPDYNGENLGSYFQKLLVTSDNAPLVVACEMSLSPSMTQRELYDALLDAARQMRTQAILPMQQRFFDKVNKVGLPQAMVRYILDTNLPPEIWDSIPFTHPELRPHYQANQVGNSETLPLFLAGSGIPRSALDRWWPVFLKSFEKVDIALPEDMYADWPILYLYIPLMAEVKDVYLQALKDDLDAGTLVYDDIPLALDTLVLAPKQLVGRARLAQGLYLRLQDVVESHNVHDLQNQAARQVVTDLFKEFYEPMNEVEEAAKQYALERQALPTPVPALPLPQSGVMEPPMEGNCTIRLIGDPTHPAYVQIFRNTAEANLDAAFPFATAFVRGGDTMEMKVLTGDYRIRIFWGEDWYGAGAAFGPEGSHQQSGQSDRLSFDQVLTYTLEAPEDLGKKTAL